MYLNSYLISLFILTEHQMPFLSFETNAGRERLADAIQLTRTQPEYSINQSGVPKDKKLILAYLDHDRCPLHISRTLDQFYYYVLPDTTSRDTDQVVYRYTAPK